VFSFRFEARQILFGKLNWKLVPIDLRVPLSASGSPRHFGRPSRPELRGRPGGMTADVVAVTRTIQGTLDAEGVEAS
jgi:hypothetical protein